MFVTGLCICGGGGGGGGGAAELLPDYVNHTP